MSDLQTDDVFDLLRRRGLRMTPQRRAIVAEIMRTKGHISPAALARSIQGDMPGVNASTIYRTLTLLEELGVLAHAHLEGGAEYHRAEEPAHVHLTCSNCGAEDDLSTRETRELEELIRRRHDFAPDLTHFAISGLCGGCRGGPDQPPKTAGSTSPRPSTKRTPITRLKDAVSTATTT